MSQQDNQNRTQRLDTRSQKTLESDIQITRSRIDQTLSQLEHKFSPQQLLNDTLDYFHNGGPGEFTGNLGDSVKNNPMPVVLTAVGLSWLMIAPRSGPSPANNGVGGDSSPTATALSEDGSSSSPSRLSNTRDRARSAWSGVGRRAGNMRSSVSNRSGQMRDGSRATAQNASRGARDAGNQAVQFVQDNPLAAAVIGLGIGAAIGGLFPASRIENEQLGGMRDDIMDKASDAGMAQAEKAQAKVEDQAQRADPDQSSGSASGGGASTAAMSGSTSDTQRSTDNGHAQDDADDSDRNTRRESFGSGRSKITAAGDGRSTSEESAAYSDAPQPGAREQAPDTW